MDTASVIWFGLAAGLMLLQIAAAANAAHRRSIRVAIRRQQLVHLRYRPRLIAVCAGLLSLVAVSPAFAGEAAQIAARGGFLVGHAYRCGVSANQLRPSTHLIGALITALSFDGDEETAAVQAFLENLLTGARASPADDRVASCILVRRELGRLEQHHASRSHPVRGSNVQLTPSTKVETPGRLGKPVQRVEAASTQPEELSRTSAPNSPQD